MKPVTDQKPSPVHGPSVEGAARAVIPGEPDRERAFPVLRPSRYATAAWCCLGLALLFIIYETTRPFQFEYSLAQLSRGWERVEWIPFHWVVSGQIGRADAVVNVVLFIPYGLCLALCPLFTHSGKWRSLLLAATGLMTSAFIESWQLFSPARFPQTSDMVSNLAGTLVGVGLAGLTGRALFDRACDWSLHKLRYDPPTLIWAFLTAAILLGSLLPLDFVVKWHTLVRSFRMTDWSPFTAPPGGWTLASLGLIKRGWLFAFWGALAAHRFRHRERPLVQVVIWAASLAMASELAGFLVVSRYVSSLSAIVVWGSASLAAALTLWFLQTGMHQRNLAITAGLGYLIYLTADCLSPLTVQAVRSILVQTYEAGSHKSGIIPLLPVGPLPTLVALGDWLAGLVRFVPLGLGLQLFVTSPRLRVTSIALAATLVLGIELLVWRYAYGAGNLLQVFMAWLGMGVGCLAGIRIACYRQATPRKPGDLDRASSAMSRAQGRGNPGP